MISDDGWWANSQSPTIVESRQQEDLTNKSRLLFVTLSGGLGGAVGDTVMHSLDTVKTRQQAAPYEYQYRTMIRAFCTIGKYEGITRGLYSGYGAALLGSFPTTSAFFFVYESSKRYMKSKLGIPDTLTHLTCGFLGDFACSFIYVPSEVLKTRLQLQGRYNNPYFNSGYNYNGLIDAVRKIIKLEGYKALFFGYKATLMRDLPFSAFQFAFYEKFHEIAQLYVGLENNMGLLLELSTGASAGGLAGIITTPLDVVKTRTQTQITTTTSSPKIGSRSVFNSLGLLYKQQGISGLFSGVGPRFVWTSIQSSIMLVLYQYILKEFNHVFPSYDLEP